MSVNSLEHRRSEARESGFAREFIFKLVPIIDGTHTIPVRPLDVSRRGLGFLSREVIDSGQIFSLVIDGYQFRVEVAYCNPYLGIDGLFRCGLFLREEHGDLAGLCRKLGLINGNRMALYVD